MTGGTVPWRRNLLRKRDATGAVLIGETVAQWFVVTVTGVALTDQIS